MVPGCERETDQSDNHHGQPDRARTQHGRELTLLLPQISKELRDGKTEGDERKRRSDPGDLRSFVSEQCALTGETRAGIRIIYRNVLGVFVSRVLVL